MSVTQRYRRFQVAELDLLPMMNVFVLLVPMLLSSAVFLKITVIDTHVPSEQSGSPSPGENLSLAITIKDDYFVVEGKGIQARAIARTDSDAPAKLAEALADVAAQHPDNQEVIIISQPKTRYQDIIEVMDISRISGLPNASLLGAQ